MTIKAKVGNHDVPINLTFKEVLEILPGDFDIHLSKAFTDPQESNKLLVKLLLDDELVIKLCLYFGKNSTLTSDDLMKLNSNDLEDFRQKFWEAFTDFSPALRRPMMMEAWMEAKVMIKSQGKNSDS